MEDPQIGRFWTVDPLSDSFRYNSTYAFSENKLTGHIELEGLEAMPLLGLTDVILGNNEVIARPVVETAVKTATDVGGKVAEVGSKASETQDHHIIPQQFKGDPVVEAAREGGFKFDGAENKVPLERFSRQTGEGQHGNHPNYNKTVGEKLADFNAKNPNATPKQAAEFVKGLVKELGNTIGNNPGAKVNDLFKVSVPPATDNTGHKPYVDPTQLKPPASKQSKPLLGSEYWN